MTKDNFEKCLSFFDAVKKHTFSILADMGKRCPKVRYLLFVLLITFVFVYNVFLHLFIQMHMREKLSRGLAIAMSLLLFLGSINITVFAMSADDNHLSDEEQVGEQPIACDSFSQEHPNFEEENTVIIQNADEIEDESSTLEVDISDSQPEVDEVMGGEIETEIEEGGFDQVSEYVTEVKEENSSEEELQNDTLATSDVFEENDSILTPESVNSETVEIIDELEIQEPKENLMPAFSETVLVGDVLVSVSAEEGVFPEGVKLAVSPVEPLVTQEAIDQNREEGRVVAATYSFDIKVYDVGGNEVQPLDGSKVKVSFSLAEAGNSNLQAEVYHINDNVAEVLPSYEEGEKVVAETSGFSYYTVEFTYAEKQYVLKGNQKVLLIDILNSIGLSGNVSSVVVSNTGLFDAYINDNDIWEVSAKQPFTSNEWMKVIIDDVEYEISVTDEVVDNHLSVKISSNTGDNVSTKVTPGETVVLTADVTGDDLDGLQYSWYKYTYDPLTMTYGAPLAIDGEVNSNISITATNNTSYMVQVQDKYGNYSSTAYTINIENHLVVMDNGTSYSKDIYIKPGDNTTVQPTVAADDLGGIIYIWSLDETKLDESGASCTVNSIQRNCKLNCKVVDKYGNSVGITYNIKIENGLGIEDKRTGGNVFIPWVTENVKVNLGADVTLRPVVSAKNTEGLVYKWFMAQSTGNNSYNYVELEGVISDSYTLTNVQEKCGYQCQVTDIYGNTARIDYSVSIENRLSVTGVASGDVVCKESYNSQTIDCTTSVGGNVTLKVSVDAIDKTGITYKWERYNFANNVREELADGDTFEIQNADTSYTYDCHVTDRFGNTEYYRFELKIDNNLGESVKVKYKGEYIEGNAVRVQPGDSLEFEAEVTALDKDNLTYEWYVFDGEDSGYLSHEREIQTAFRIYGGHGGNLGIQQDCNERTFLLNNIRSSGEIALCVIDKYGNRAESLYVVHIIVDNLKVPGQEGSAKNYIIRNINVPNGGNANLTAEYSIVDAENLFTGWYQKIDNEFEGYYYYEDLHESGESLTVNNVRENREYLYLIIDKYNNVCRFTYKVGLSGTNNGDGDNSKSSAGVDFKENVNTIVAGVAQIGLEEYLTRIGDLNAHVSLNVSSVSEGVISNQNKSLILGIAHDAYPYTNRYGIEYLDIAINKESAGVEENVPDLGMPIEIELTIDTTGRNNFIIMREHNGVLMRFEKLDSRATSPYADGKYAVVGNKLYIYSQYYSTYVIMYEKTGESADALINGNSGGTSELISSENAVSAKAAPSSRAPRTGDSLPSPLLFGIILFNSMGALLVTLIMLKKNIRR